MCDTPFKTPLPMRHRDYNTPAKDHSSDSDQSTSSNGDSANLSEISTSALFDDYVRLVKHKRNNHVENTMIMVLDTMREVWGRWQECIGECRRLQDLVEKTLRERNEMESSLQLARKMFDKQKNLTEEIQLDKMKLEINLVKFQEVFNEINTERVIPNPVKEKIDSISEQLGVLQQDRSFACPVGNLSAIREINSTGSLLSDINYSRSEDDLDDNSLYRPWKKHRASAGGVPEPATKKRRSSSNKVIEVNNTDTVRATTTLTVSKGGPITATSVVESIPQEGKGYQGVATAPPADLVFESWSKGVNDNSPAARTDQLQARLKQHVFHQRQIYIPDACGVCPNRIRFGKTALKCKNCKVLCHLECKDRVPSICVPVINTPTQKNMLGIISDYTPTTPPMVPGIMLHCINEIELRGLTEVGVYRVSGAERDVKVLKEKFLKGKTAPSLNQIDIHVVCGTLKDFLRSLSEPIVTFGLWKKFVGVCSGSDRNNVASGLYQVISELPQPNRDTLAYLVLHLQKVAMAKECHMPISNLAKVFGPTVVGYSCEDPSPSSMITETRQQVLVMDALMNLPLEYWAGFVNVAPATHGLRQTPSTDSLLRNAKGGMFTPIRNNTIRRKFYLSPSFN